MRRAAEMDCVPKSTLQDQISGRVAFGTKSGPESYLTKEEEEQLVDFIQKMFRYWLFKDENPDY